MSVSILKAVWGKKSGYVFVPRRNPNKLDAKGKPLWDEGKAYKYPEDWEEIRERVITSAKSGYDTYWCPLVFEKPQRLKENVLPNQSVLWADLDPVDPTTLGELTPSIAWKSSDERYQALWFLDADYPIDMVERINRGVSYHIGADKGGWDVGQVLRVPGSPNYKYTPPQQGKVLWAETRQFNIYKVGELVATTEPAVPVKTALSLEKMLEGWKIPARTKDLLFVDAREVEVGDRSDRLWEIETSLLEAGLPVLLVVDIVTVCPWNKFKGRKGEHEQIYNEVLKADAHVKTKPETRLKDSPITLTPEELERKREDWAIPFAKFASKRMEKPEWLVEGIWQKGTYGMIAGEPKTYKSVQATDLGLSVASGKAYLNYFPVRTTGAVLYVQEENNEQTVQDRIFKIAASKGLLQSTSYGWQLPNDLPFFVSNNYGIDLTSTDSRKLLEETIQEIKPVLLILDPLYMMLGAVDENNATEVGDVLRWLTHLRNTYGVAILICHHYNKESSTSSKRGGQRVRGSSAFHAWVESALYVKTTPELFTVKLEREFRAYPTMPELTLKLGLGNPGDLTYIPKILAKSDEDKDDEILETRIDDVCTLLSMSPKTEEELEVECKIMHSQMHKIITVLLDSGRIEKVPGIGRGRKTTYILK